MVGIAVAVGDYDPDVVGARIRDAGIDLVGLGQVLSVKGPEVGQALRGHIVRKLDSQAQR